MVKYYTGNVTNTPETIGVLPKPLYWWQAGAMWGLLLDYYHYTGDSTYNNITTQALLSQVGPEYDYMVPLYKLSEGNDDQAFWGFATMSAAEKDFPQPTIGNYTWVELTEKYVKFSCEIAIEFTQRGTKTLFLILLSLMFDLDYFIKGTY